VERASKLDPGQAAAPSFLGKSVESAAAAEKEAEAAADQRALRRAEFFEGVEIDPRGFIVPQAGPPVPRAPPARRSAARAGGGEGPHASERSFRGAVEAHRQNIDKFVFPSKLKNERAAPGG
jgi:hypothetical protein